LKKNPGARSRKGKVHYSARKRKDRREGWKKMQRGVWEKRREDDPAKPTGKKRTGREIRRKEGHQKEILVQGLAVGKKKKGHMNSLSREFDVDRTRSWKTWRGRGKNSSLNGEVKVPGIVGRTWARKEF